MVRKKRMWIIAAAALLLLLLAFASLPRATAWEQVSFSSVTAEEYPALYRAYQQLLQDNSLAQVTCEDTLRIVTVRNLWSSCEYYVLPCYIVDLDTVPHAGSVNWNAAVHILAVCSDEDSMAAKLSSLKVSEFTLEMEPGANTFVSSYADVLPSDIRVDDPRKVTSPGSVDCLRDPQISVSYSVGTDESAQQREVVTQAYFDWYYSLYCCGKPIVGYHELVCQEYIVNA